MTVKQVTAYTEGWHGLSTDTKPTAVDGVDIGASFTETDTGLIWEYAVSGWFIKTNAQTPTAQIGVPQTFTKLTENSSRFSIQKGQLNKLNLRPRINNEHCESSRDEQSIVTTNNIVGQVFKASKDNISGLFLTLESAAGGIIDNFESYGDSTELQAIWTTTGGASPALLETAIVSSGAKAMSLEGNNTANEWTGLFAATDYSGSTGSFDIQFTKDPNKMQFSVFIGDGTNTKSFLLVFGQKDTWYHFEILESSMTEDGAGVTDILNITQIGFRVIVSDKSGEFAYVDNLLATPPPGDLEIKLWDMGTTLPVSGTTTLGDGTQNTKINGSASSVTISLLGGKRIYHLHNTFNVGVYKNNPSNELLIPGNYYIIELKYVDTDVSVYGPSISYATQRGAPYYTNGYAFSIDNTGGTGEVTNPITSLGPYADLMFIIQSMQPIYVTEVEWRPDATSNGNSDLFIFLEDNDMVITDVVIDHEEQPDNQVKDLSLRPMPLEDGGKVEFYYNDDYTDSISEVVVEVAFLHEPQIING